MSKQRPILFSTPMVEAINLGIKSKTRRTKGLDEINKQGWAYSHSSLDGNVPHPAKKYDTAPWYLFNAPNGNHKSWIMQSPYGQVGDILWVRETTRTATHYGVNELLFQYKDGTFSKHIDKRDLPLFTSEAILNDKWTPSIHMKKIACRIWLKIVSVKVERLQDITGEEAIKEGIMPLAMSSMQLARTGQLYFDYTKPKQLFNDGLPPFWSFCSLWCSINGDESWDANPWVWVIEFERTTKPMDSGN